ncbi:exodeoxyribonuclease 7 large subunit [bacterium BMS3Bbin06]|nr:exodeoxyribonuclease 7 large subunit [bacterium BMS3Bbin06]
MNYLTLKELTSIIKATLSVLSDEYWVVAEIAGLSCDRKGHCYLGLVEKEDDIFAAKMRATIWARKYKHLRATFRKQTGRELQADMKVLMLVRVNYHEVHGLSLDIQDIDPRYTLGEMALKRRQVIEQLTKEGIINNNKGLPLPLVPQRIAVITSKTAAGYGDFMNEIDNNPYGYRFSITLIESLVQGEQAESSLLSALQKIRDNINEYDLAVIIRGGGSTADLHCFDSYPVAKEVALLPIPVLAGIGHTRDETVVDSVVHERLITPTAVAEFIIQKVRSFEDMVDELRDRLVNKTRTLIEREEYNLSSGLKSLLSASGNYLATHRHGLLATIQDFDHTVIQALSNRHNRLDRSRVSLMYLTERYVSRQSDSLDRLETIIRLLDPLNILKRGYSVTRFNGEALKNASVLKEGDIIDTRLHAGAVTSTVKKIREDIKREK